MLIATEPRVGGETKVANAPASWAKKVRWMGIRSGTNPVSDQTAARNVTRLKIRDSSTQPQFAVLNRWTSSTWANCDSSR